MALDDDQKKFLSSLRVGHAVVFSGDWPKAIHVNVPKIVDTSEQRMVRDAELRGQAIRYLASQYRRGIFPGLELLASAPSQALVDVFCRDVLYVDYKDSIQSMITPGMGRDKQREKVRRVVLALVSAGVAEEQAWQIVATIIVSSCLKKQVNQKTRELVAEELSNFVRNAEYSLASNAFQKLTSDFS